MENLQQQGLCVKGCGFHGNPMYAHMCSKCFRECEQASKNKNAAEMPTTSDTGIANDAANANIAPAKPNENATESSSAICANAGSEEAAPETDMALISPQIHEDPAQSRTDSREPEAEKETQPQRPKQTDMGRCFVCRAKVPLLKQATNKCKCESVFCDKHKFPQQMSTETLIAHAATENNAPPSVPAGDNGNGHGCDFDYQSRGKAILEKFNPKLHDKKTAGRDFQRI